MVIMYIGANLSLIHILETFHVLTDGTGAMQFLKAVCYRYCQLAHPDAFTPEQLATPYGTCLLYTSLRVDHLRFC